jgi:predicted permease
VKSTLRSLARSPGFTAVAVLTLALGIGSTTTVFSWIERVLLDPLPGVAEPHRLLALETRTPAGERIDTSYPDFLDYRAQAESFSHLVVHKERPLTLGAGDDAERVWAEMVSGDFFAALGVPPLLGRFFVPADHADDSAAAPLAVIGESLWRRRFAADPAIVGRTVKLNQRSFIVIGVAPAAFLGAFNGLAFDVWVPLGAHAQLLGPSAWLESRGWRALHVLGRLAPGASLASAQSELAGITARLEAADPTRPRGLGLVAMPLVESKDGAHAELARPLFILLGACGLLLLVVCANLSNLLLVRASARQREMCIRQALGADWRRLVRQLLAESLLLSIAGTAVGLLFTVWMSDLLRGFIPDPTLPISLVARLDLRVLLLAAGLSTLAAVLAGLAPALWAARADVMQVLRATGRAAALTPRVEFFRRALVVAQVAIALVTLASAALATKSFRAARHAAPGFDPAGVLLAALKLDASGYTAPQAAAFLERLQARLAALPGVEAAAVAEDVPLGFGRGSWEEIAVPGYAHKPHEELRVYRNLVSPGYFSLMRIPLLGGREFDAADRDGAREVAIVSETFARRYFGTQNAVGRTFSIWGGQRVLTVVGIARDVQIEHIGEAPRPYFYVSLPQFLSAGTGVVIHLRAAGSSSDPMRLLPDLRAAVHALDPNLPIFEAITLEDHTAASRFVQKIAAGLLGVLATMALALTALGLYGVLACAVAQRTSEFGVRLALGAQPSDIARLVLSRGAVLIALGLGLGMAIAAGAGLGLAAFFYGVQPFEPGLLALAAAAVLAAALAACWFPARRAAHVDPAIALRAE